jgi:hypothetical protein
LTALVLALSPSLTGGDDAQKSGAPSPAALERGTLTSPATERAVDAGLAYLAELQTKTGDGSFPVSDALPADQAPLGVSALCTLAFLAAGNSPGRGPYGAVVERGVDYLLLHTDLAAESPTRGYITAQGDGLSRTHGHGYATLVLAETYGMSKTEERLRLALVAAVKRIEKSQGAEGGWYYDPTPAAAHEGSVTICLVQALRAARDAGIQVSAEVIRRAEDYVRRLQLDNGRFCYTLGDAGRTTIGLTAAGIATLNAAGRYDDKSVRAGIDAIWTALGLRAEGNDPIEHPEYERLYVAQAFWQLSDTSHFQRWFEPERARLLRTQERDGSWKGTRFSSAYATAVHCLVLSLPDTTLPIFQR